MIYAAMAFLCFVILLNLENGSASFSLFIVVFIMWQLLARLNRLQSKVQELEDKLKVKPPEPTILQQAKVNTQSEPEKSAEAENESSIEPDINSIPEPAPSFPNVTPYHSPLTEPEPLEQQEEPEPAYYSSPIAQQAKERATQWRTPEPTPSFLSIWVKKLMTAAWNWVSGGNVFVRVGIIILLMGMTFLTRHAINQNMIPIEFRLLAIATAAIVLLFWGWKQRDQRRQFALVVQGGAIGLFYLTIFASFSLYNILPSTLAFAILILIVIFAVTLAIRQDAKALALFATIGGFLAPILTASGSNNYIGLFGYYTVLNLGIFAVSWFKSWRVLNFAGFVATFLISTIWGILRYEPQFFATTEPFLIGFFLMYVSISILYAYHQKPEFKNYLDSTLIFGTPLIAFNLQSGMVYQYEYGIAISAFILSLFYFTVAWVLRRQSKPSLQSLGHTFIALSVIFFTIAIPFAIDGTLTGAIWAIEGAGILWISIKQQQTFQRFFSIGLMFCSFLILLYELFWSDTPVILDQAFINSAFIASVIITIATTIGSWLLSRSFEGKKSIENTLGYCLMAYGLFVLFEGFIYQIVFFSFEQPGHLWAWLSLAAGLFYCLFGKFLSWPLAHKVASGFIIPLIIGAVLSYQLQTNLAEHNGYLIWPLALGAYFYCLKQALEVMNRSMLYVLHGLAVALITALLLWEGLWQLLLGFSLLAIMFDQIGSRLQWLALQRCALGLLPALAIVAFGAITIDGNFNTLSSIGSPIKWPLTNGAFLWPLSFAVFFYLLYKNTDTLGKLASYLNHMAALLGACMLWWLGQWPLLLGATVLCSLCIYLWHTLSWQAMRTNALALLPILGLLMIMKLLELGGDPMSLTSQNLAFSLAFEIGYWVWPAAFIALLFIFWLCDKKDQAAPGLWHGASLLLLGLLMTWKASWHMLGHVSFSNGWHIALLPLMSLASLILIHTSPFWPFKLHRSSYLRFASPVLMLVIFAWSLLQLITAADSQPLPWLPILNPVDIVQMSIVIASLLLLKSAEHSASDRLRTLKIIGGFIFLWANVIMLRIAHHWGDVEWQLSTLLTSSYSQTLLSLLWGISGLAATTIAAKKGLRGLWITGAVLMGAVVLKLFLIDISAQDTIERIISFTGVGLLLTLIGYFAPLPPSQKDDTEIAA